MDPEQKASGMGFERAAAAVAALAVAAWVLIFFLGRIDAGDRASLESARAALQGLSNRPGSLPTPHAVQAWEAHRGRILKVRDELESALAARDANVEKSFDEYDPRRDSGAKFRGLYNQKAGDLYKRAEPVAMRDSNGAPCKAKELFDFVEWTWDPNRPEEIVLALKKFWIQEAAVDVLLAVAAKEREDHLAPRLVSIRVDNPPADLPAGAVHESIPASLEVLLDARDIEGFLAGILGPGKHGLLTRISRFKAEKTEALKMSYEISLKEGEEMKTKPANYLKPVKVLLEFEVVDYAAGKPKTGP